MLNNNVTEKKTKDNIVELHMKDPGFSVTEAFNTLRTNIMFSGENIKTVMVTSTNPAEGKSFIAMQLAKSFADINKKVVYIDCDLRKSVTLSRYKIRGKRAGLTEYITGQRSQLIYETNYELLTGYGIKLYIGHGSCVGGSCCNKIFVTVFQCNNKSHDFRRACHTDSSIFVITKKNPSGISINKDGIFCIQTCCISIYGS